MYFNYQEKTAVEAYIRSLGIVPNHNFLIVQRGLAPSLHALLKTDLLYSTIFSKPYLLIFTSTAIVLKKTGTDQPARYFNHQKITRFRAGELRLAPADCIRFKAPKNYFFYLNSTFTVTSADFSSLNYELLQAKDFYLTKTHFC